MSYHVLDENDFVTYYLDGESVQVGSIRLKEIFRAELEGRLAILDEPKRPLVWGDPGHDTVLCPRCLCDLMGGFEFAVSSETQMVQCPHCGCPVDTSKAVEMETNHED